VDVLENEDASLLLIVQPRWGWRRRWEILDADHRRVGSFRSGRFAWSPDVVKLWRLATPVDSGRHRFLGTLVEDWYGRVLAWIEAPITRSPARLIAPDGEVVGTVAERGPDTVVKFAVVLEGNPFAKMALLAAVLLNERVPPATPPSPRCPG
jgi:hypothetical protein